MIICRENNERAQWKVALNVAQVSVYSQHLITLLPPNFLFSDVAAALRVVVIKFLRPRLTWADEAARAAFALYFRLWCKKEFRVRTCGGKNPCLDIEFIIIKKPESLLTLNEVIMLIQLSLIEFALQSIPLIKYDSY